MNLEELVRRKSAFLFGPRSTGKSFWIRHELSEHPYINLLRAIERRRYLSDPSLLEQVARTHSGSLIIIDEIQLVPELLDEVHDIIERSDCRFLLAGSSARKLKRSGANMLGGRARQARMHPLTWRELESEGIFELDRYLQFGGLPSIYLSDEPEEELSDYVDTYLDQEIKAEAVSRNISGFESFFARAAMASGEVLNYSRVASDAQLSPPTVRSYYEVLEDTFLGFHLTPWKGPKRKAIQSSKFYIFDVGLAWFLAGVSALPPQSDLFGRAFESFIVQEIHALNSYRRLRKKLRFWRTTHGDEVDLIAGDDFAIEIKSSRRATEKHIRGLRKIRDEGYPGRLVLVSRDPIRRTDRGVEFWPYEEFLEDLWRSW